MHENAYKELDQSSLDQLIHRIRYQNLVFEGLINQFFQLFGLSGHLVELQGRGLAMAKVLCCHLDVGRYLVHQG